MYSVYFFENKDLLLTQFLKQVPSAGEAITIKGRKGKVSNVNSVDEKRFYVHVTLETVNKNKLIVDNSKKKKGK
ncbi:MAG: hypothetical protein Q8934_18330 [Bacillota bacterium]|nr:hypothetical protein [Bacillota bacterium]